MASLLKRLRDRTVAKADELAAGSEAPAGQEPPDPEAQPRPTARERGAMRRRLRRLRRAREALLLELGALVFELHRRGRPDSQLVQRRVEELTAIEDEARGLAHALGEEHTLARVVAEGIAGACQRCGALLSRGDRFCSSCGAPVSASEDEAARPPGAADAAADGSPDSAARASSSG
jgi:zinc ribbon protein